MNFFVLIVFIIEAILGIGSSIGILVLLIGTLVYKFIRMIRDGKTLYQ